MIKKLLLLFSIGLFFGEVCWSQSSDYPFTENKGQWPNHVEYAYFFAGGNIAFNKSGVVYHLMNGEQLSEVYTNHTGRGTLPFPSTINGHVFNMKFVNSNSEIEITPHNKGKSYNNYFLGNDKSKWANEVHNYQEVKYKSIYPKINAIFRTSNGRLKYDFIVLPKGNPNIINLKFEGTDQLNISSEGNLIITTSVGKVQEQNPVAFQYINGDKVIIQCRFKLNNETVSFELGDYNDDYELIIDPEVLIFSSYSGSPVSNFGMTATYDLDGNLYAGGITFGQGFPTTVGAYDTTYANTAGQGITDVVITKYDSAGVNQIYSTYIGGGINNEGTETVNSLIVNNQNELFLFGVTSSPNFPTTLNAYDNSFAGGDTVGFAWNGVQFNHGTDIYAAKLSTDGTQLLGSTYIGGSKNDGINANQNYYSSGILGTGSIGYWSDYDSLQWNYGDQIRGEVMVDSAGYCYIASCTNSNNFPIINGFQNNFGGQQDGVILKLAPDLSSIEWSSYLGGTDKDAAYSVKLGTNDTVYIAGGTSSNDFPVSANGLNPNYLGGVADGYVAKVSPNGDSLIKSTFFGTADYDQNYFIELDRFDDVYIMGQSEGSIPVINAAYSNSGSGQFISKLNNNLDGIIYSTVFGNGNGIILSPAAFLVDYCQNVYVSGWGGSLLDVGNPVLMDNMPITDSSFQENTANGYDFYLFVLQRDADTLLYGSYFGGAQSKEHVDGGTSRFDKNGIIYQSVCAGCSNNDDFPTTPGVWSEENESTGCNNGVFKLDFRILPKSSFQISNIQGCAPFTVNMANTSSSSDSYLWDFGNGDTTSNHYSPTVTFDTAGVYTVKLFVTDSICQLTDSSYKIVTVFPPPTSNEGIDTTICFGDGIEIGTSFNSSYTYEWSNSSISDTSIIYVSPTTSSSYILEITDTNSCNTLDTFNVTPIIIQLTETNNSPTVCSNCIGESSVIATNGNPPYNYEWSNNDSTNTSTGLCSGLYSVTTTDLSGCSSVLSIAITDTSNLLLSSPITIPVSCIDSCDGSTTISASGGTGPFTYEWNTGSTGNAINNLCFGEYLVTVIDANNCQRMDTIIIENATALQNVISSTSVDCFDECSGTANVNVSGGESPYSYLWDNTQTTLTASGLCAQIYDVTITDANNCVSLASISISEPAELFADLTSNNESCQNYCDGTALASPLGGTSPYSYLWNNNLNTSEITNLCPGTYLVLITDNNGCSYTDTVIVNEAPNLTELLSVSANPDTIIIGESTQLEALPIGDYQYLWSPNNSLSDNSSSPTATPIENTLYSVSITPNNSNCVLEAQTNVIVLELVCEEPNVFVPRAFTPDGDGLNDILYVRGENIEKMVFSIRNRWGEKVFETTDQSIGWDATYKGKPVDPAVFVYYLDVECIDGQSYFHKGNVTVIR